MRKDKSVLNSQRIENVFHLKSNLEDVLYSSPSFEVEQVEGEIIRFRKTRISFNSLHSMNRTSWVSPDIDSINFIDFITTDDGLFTNLVSLGYNSVLLHLFSENERMGESFKDPEFDNYLLKRATSKIDDGTFQYYYHLSIIFQVVL